MSNRKSLKKFQKIYYRYSNKSKNHSKFLIKKSKAGNKRIASLKS